jgi:Arc/MetJ family transcription regulator
MATNLELDDQLILEAKRLGNFATKREAVTAALEEFVRRRKQLGILKLIGKVEYYDDYDYKKLRRKR